MKNINKSIVLTDAQQRAGNAILSLLADTKDQPCVIALIGLSGVGKSLVLEAFAERIAELGAVREPFYQIALPEYKEKLGRRVVIDAHPKNLTLIQDEARKMGRQCKVVTLMGMTWEDFQTYQSGELEFPAQVLSLAKQYSLSLGVPLLVSRMLASGMDEQEAIYLVSHYLLTQLEANKVTLDHLDAYFYPMLDLRIRQMCVRHGSPAPGMAYQLFERIKHAEARATDFALKTGVRHTYQFVVEQSRRMYEMMLSKQHALCEGNTTIRLFLPSLSLEQYAEIKALLLEYDTKWKNWEVSDREGYLHIFGVWPRKCGIVAEDPSADEHIVILHESSAERELVRLRKKYAGRLEKFWPALKRDDRSLYIEAHDHSAYDAIRWGWALETWCQARGVPYWVKNGPHESQYVYVPAQNELQFLLGDERLEVMY